MKRVSSVRSKWMSVFNLSTASQTNVVVEAMASDSRTDVIRQTGGPSTAASRAVGGDNGNSV